LASPDAQDGALRSAGDWHGDSRIDCRDVPAPGRDEDTRGDGRGGGAHADGFAGGAGVAAMKRHSTLAWWSFALVAGGVCLLLASLSGARQAPELSVPEVLAVPEVRAAQRVLSAARAERIDNETAAELARVDPAE